MPDFDRERRYLDKTAEAQYALWNGLLTVNGIVASVFSVVGILEGAPTSRFVVCALILLLCTVSSALLIANFTEARNLFRSIGQLDAMQFEKLTEEERRRDIQRAHQAHEMAAKSELWAKRLLGLAVLLVFIVVFTSR
jgi:hypothetical protein